MAIARDEIPQKLLQNYGQGKCGFFVGAGLSRGAGFPDWEGLLVGMIDHGVNCQMISDDKAAECRELATDQTKYLMLAEELKEVLGPTEFKSFLEETFLRKDVQHRPVHSLLVTLRKAKFIITTNYDVLIESAFAQAQIRPTVLKYYEAHAIQRQLHRRDSFVLKAHGDAETAAEEVVLTDKDYRRLLYQEPGYQSALQSIFTMYSVIFLGCSLDDPELHLLLNYINAAFPKGGVPHYALMSAANILPTERSRWKKDYNMQIIPISPDNNYADIDTFLEILHEEEGEQQ